MHNAEQRRSCLLLLADVSSTPPAPRRTTTSNKQQTNTAKGLDDLPASRCHCHLIGANVSASWNLKSLHHGDVQPDQPHMLVSGLRAAPVSSPSSSSTASPRRAASHRRGEPCAHVGASRQLSLARLVWCFVSSHCCTYYYVSICDVMCHTIKNQRSTRGLSSLSLSPRCVLARSSSFAASPRIPPPGFRSPLPPYAVGTMDPSVSSSPLRLSAGTRASPAPTPRPPSLVVAAGRHQPAAATATTRLRAVSPSPPPPSPVGSFGFDALKETFSVDVAAAGARPLRVPLAAPFTIASSRLAALSNVAVRVELRSGAVGWGEAPVLPSVTAEDQPAALGAAARACAALAAAPAAPLGALLQDVAGVLPGHAFASVSDPQLLYVLLGK
jgi:hypothetical protein